MQYIPDKEINLLEEDLLGTMSYVNTLKDIIVECDTPFTIGLFGGWGTGKSSIVNTFKEIIQEEEEEKVKVIKYDAWKYSNDSFRRTFILELKEKLKLKSKQDLNKAFYQDELEEKDFKLKLKEFWYLYLIPIAFVFIFIIAFWFFTDAERDIKIIISVFGFIASALTFFLANVLIVHKTTIIHSKIFSPEQFEEIFLEIVGEITPFECKTENWIQHQKRQHRYERFVIIIDNLDRCRKETAIELMLTIKNFLEKERCIFILPVDNIAIKRFLQLEEQKDKTKTRKIDGDEFLRKFFNTSIRIKNLTNYELYEFAQNLNRKHALDLSNDTLSIIAQEFARNPRRIIQFLNNLLTESKVLVNARELGHLHSDDILGNIEFLAKILIIKEEWPNLFGHIIEDNQLLRKINERISEIDLNEERLFPIEINKELKLSKDQYYFFIRTRAFSSENIEPFIKTKDVLRDLPDDIERLVLEQNWEEIKSIFNKAFDFNNLIDFILYLFDRDVIRRSLIRQSGYNLISLVMRIGLDEEYQNEYNVHFRRLSALFDKQYLNQIINIVIPELIVKFSRIHLDKGQKNVINSIITHIKHEEITKQKEDLLSQLILEYPENEAILVEIKSEFTKLIIQNEEVLRSIEHFIEEPKKVLPLITKELIEHFINTIVQDPNQKLTKQKVMVIKSILFLDDFNDLIQQFVNRTVNFPQTNNLEIIKYWLDIFYEFLTENSQIIYPQIYEVVNNRQTFFVQRIGSKKIPENEGQEELLISQIRLIKKLYILFTQSRIPLSDMLLFYYREDIERTLNYVDAFFKEIFSKNITTEWQFAQGLLNKFNGFSNLEVKEIASDTLILMLENNKSLEIIDNNLVESVIDGFFNLLISDDPSYLHLGENSISRLMKINHLTDIMGKKFEQFLEQEPAKIIEILVKFPEEETKERITIHLFLKILDYSKIPSISSKMLNSSEKGTKLLKNTLMGTLKLISIENKEHYITILETCIHNIKIFSQEEKHRIIAKINPLFSYGDLEKIKALELLDKVDKIPRRSITLILTSLEEISDFDNEDNNKLLSRVKKKFSNK